VARLWEEKLDDPREAADAWRRVLRMKQGDPEAIEGLERAKSGMLKRPKDDPPSAVDAAPPEASAPAPAVVKPAPEDSADEPTMARGEEPKEGKKKKKGKESKAPKASEAKPEAVPADDEMAGVDALVSGDVETAVAPTNGPAFTPALAPEPPGSSPVDGAGLPAMAPPDVPADAQASGLAKDAGRMAPPPPPSQVSRPPPSSSSGVTRPPPPPGSGASRPPPPPPRSHPPLPPGGRPPLPPPGGSARLAPPPPPAGRPPPLPPSVGDDDDGESVDDAELFEDSKV
jgi:hypothetical protein